MKKQLLVAALLMGTFFTFGQQSISFEASEGFVPGEIEGQQDWNLSTSTTAGASADPALFTISTAEATNGTQSLLMEGGNGTNHSLRGAFSPEFSVTGDMLYFSFDLKTSELTANGSDFYISAQSPSEELLTSRIVFSFDGTIYVLDYEDPADPESLGYIEVADVTYEGDTWYNVEMVQDNVAGTIKYYLNDALIHTGAAFGAEGIEQLVLMNDNYEGSAYMDNISVTNTLGVNQVLASQFSVYPNPTSNVVNIANADALVTGVAVVDINGRTVKSASFDGVSEAQINIADLSAGVYLMNISSDKGMTTKKIVKN